MGSFVGLPLRLCEKVALLDEDDYFRFGAFNWYLNENGYVVTDSSKPGQRLGWPDKVRLHRLIMLPPNGMDVDHVNGDKLDNRKANLRVCSRSENLSNKALGWNKKTLPKGVFLRKPYKGCPNPRKKFFVTIYQRATQKSKYIGSFYTPEEAAEAFKKAELAEAGRFSVFARTTPT